ncbi:MAG: recombinase family protein [Dehalococcoidia bacterium]
MEGTNHWAREGVWLGGIVPYGYRKVGDKKSARLIVSEELVGGVGMTEAEVIRLIYRLCADEGWSTIQIADHLNALDIPPAYRKDKREKVPTGGKEHGKRKEKTAGIWYPNRVRNLLVSPTYKGLHIYGKRTTRRRELIERKVPDIVSETTWEKAQDTLHRNRHARSWNAKRQYLLRGLILCRECGLTYRGTASSGSNGHLKAYYTCGGKTAYRGKFLGKCPSKAVNADWLEGEIWSDIEGFLQAPGEVLEKLADSQREAEGQGESLAGETVDLQKALEGKREERDRILDLYRRNIIGVSSLERQMDAISAEETLLSQRIVALTEQQSSQEAQRHHLETAEALLQELHKKLANPIPFEVKRQIVESLIAEIAIDTRQEEKRKEARVAVTYRFEEPVVSGAPSRRGRGSWRPQA